MEKVFTQQLIRGNLTLEHRRYRDDWGFLRDAFEVIEKHPDGRSTHYPFIAPPTVTNYDKNTPIGDIVSDYTTDDYSRMLAEMRVKFALKS